MDLYLRNGVLSSPFSAFAPAASLTEPRPQGSGSRRAMKSRVVAAGSSGKTGAIRADSDTRAGIIPKRVLCKASPPGVSARAVSTGYQPVPISANRTSGRYWQVCFLLYGERNRTANKPSQENQATETDGASQEIRLFQCGRTAAGNCLPIARKRFTS